MLYLKALINKLAFLKSSLFNNDRKYYIGYVGRKNYGDDLLFEIFQLINNSEYIPVLDIFSFQKKIKVNDLVLGGGTIINGPIYLKSINKFKVKPKLTFCSGVIPGEMSSEWVTCLEATNVYTRSKESAEMCVKSGVSAKSYVDPGVYTSILYPQSNFSQKYSIKESYLLCPHGKHSSMNFFIELIESILSDKKRNVTLFASSFEDLKICRSLSSLFNLNVIKGWLDITESNKAICQADFVISTRLHPSVVAASYGTPFLMISYEEKQKEFLGSIGCSDRLFIENDELINALYMNNIKRGITSGVEYWHKRYPDFINVFGS
ncbi:polysaccharide pyruvyl transferase family protein [Pseudoalteromonas sp. KAN5]|uniref:polysaccharide pyruvyl transferase family protein n=1 Tax=Pseudoalteromonas sp. KAN5 TaxID=2916633 RepID=UPI001FCC4DE3|nr:polysaccharide pyruvyl transferase family protein [Pseudoalteromonas sp. KAN5]BDF95564.1 hypothetical protein KAN5_24020 [Pseudoalteromonas sp. KAN5]